MQKSATSSIATSDYPIPTVSIITQSQPVCSHNVITSLVFNAIPPKNPLVGLGLMNAESYLESSSILVLSPKIEPPVF